MKSQSHRFQRFLLASVILSAASFVASPAQAATSDVACSLGGSFRIEDDVLTSSTSNCAGSITVPADVTVIGNNAFTNRLGITSVTFETGSKITRINYQAFYRSSITSIVLPNGLEFIGDGAFAEAENFTAISIPGTVNVIENYAFVRSDLRSLVFESRIAASFQWGYWLLLDNPNLISVTLKGPNKLELPSGSNFWSDNLNNAKNWDGWSLTVGGPRVSAPLEYSNTDDLTLYPKQTLKDGVSIVPCSLGGTVKIIVWKVHFVTWDCAGEVTIPATVTAIEHYFRGRDAEGGTGGLTRVTFEANSQLRTINGGVFQNTAITTISIPGSVTDIGDNAFYDSDLETVVFEPRTATSLNITNAFTENKKLRSITFSDPVVVNSSPAQVISKTAYTWVGWSSSEGGPIVTFPLTVTATNGVTLYSNFTANPYVVTYDSTGGTAVAPGSALGDQIALPTPPTRTGYSFDAWYDSASDWSRGPVTRWVFNNDATLYAKWIPNTYSVTLNAKGGSAVTAVSFVADGEISTAPATPSRVGFSFTGWSATENGTVLTFPYAPGVMENITLYAQWEKLAPVIETGPTPNSQVVTIWAGLSEAVIPATANVPSIKLGLSGTGGTAVVTVAPTVNPATSSSTPFVVTSSTKIVDINITGITGSVTICIDGAATDALFHFTGGKWEELPQRSYSNGQVCGVTSSFSPFAAAAPTTPTTVAPTTPTTVAPTTPTTVAPTTSTTVAPTTSTTVAPTTSTTVAPTTSTTVAPPAAAVAPPAAAVVVASKNSYTARTLAKRVGVKVVSPKAKVTMTVRSSSKKNCAIVAAKLKTLKAGSCVVTFTVQEPKPAKGKQPKATKSVKTLVVK